jgi:hypothetical protein
MSADMTADGAILEQAIKKVKQIQIQSQQQQQHQQQPSQLESNIDIEQIDDNNISDTGTEDAGW